MRNKRVLAWSLGLLGAGCLGWPTAASAQTSVVADAEVSATGRTQTVVVTQRPLRTFRGEAVRVGRFADDERTIGVVRPLRRVSSVYGDCRSYGRSSGVYFDSFPRVEETIGVVRPFRVYRPPVRHKPKTYTNSNAAQTPALSDAPGLNTVSAELRPVLADDVEVTAVASVVLPEAHRDDPWALLDQGYYREARQRFAMLGRVDDAEVRTGHALAAVLSGDLRGGAALMPGTPALPESVTLGAATLQRLEQTAHYLYADDSAMQAKLQTLLDAAVSDEAVADAV